MIKSIPFFVTAACLFFSGLSSCKKFVEIPQAPDQIVNDVVFMTDASANAAMTGVYSNLMRSHQSIANTGLVLYTGLSADELYPSVSNAEYENLANNTLTNTSAALGNLWQVTYQQLYHCNAVIEGLERPNGVSPSLSVQLSGEARFMRAYLYWGLVNVFGDVPLVLSTDYRANAVLPRTPVTEIYMQMVKDLTASITLLPPQVGTTRTRPGQWAAKALLARIELYLQHWSVAAQLAGEIIDSGLFSLPANLSQVFLSTSPETIWAMHPVVASIATSQANLFVTSSTTQIPPLSITDTLWNNFSSADHRASSWLRAITVNGKTYRHPFKYKTRTGNPVTEFNVLIRLAEILLIRAEARTHNGDHDGALQDLNRVHTRAGLTALVGLDEAALFRAIEHERQLELFTEGQRWFDLKRTGRIGDVILAVKGKWQPSFALYPIALTELNTNPFLIQNPGY